MISQWIKKDKVEEIIEDHAKVWRASDKEVEEYQDQVLEDLENNIGEDLDYWKYAVRYLVDLLIEKS